MKLSDISIRRPVLATVINLVVILLGLVAFNSLSVRQTPKIDTAVVSVVTAYPGANAEVIESQITKPIEDALAGIEGVEVMTSNSQAEVSNVNVVFKVDRDADSAAADVRDRVNSAKERLPFDAREPIVQKQEADSQPIIWLAFSSDRHPRVEVADTAYRLVKDRLQAIPGVAEARLFSSRYAMRIWLDPDRLAATQLTPIDVENALRAQNIEVPAGRIESEQREFTVLAQTDLRSAEEFRNVIIRDDGTLLVRLGDVARVELGSADQRSTGRFNGKNAVPMGIVRQSVANPLDIARDLREALPLISAQLPEGMKVQIAYDSTIFIDASINAVYEAVLEAVVLVVLVIFIFLRSGRATLIPLVTIPVSLIGVFALMLAFDFSINTLTLLAMVLAIGLVVDDAIVMLENIHRHIEMGKSPMQAAFDGSKEIGFAIIAMTLTLAAVYLPVAFSAGATGKLFVEFALTLAGAVIISGLTALTLSPMMSSKFLRVDEKHGYWYQLGENALNALSLRYQRGLKWTLRRSKRVAGGVLFVCFVGIWALMVPSATRLNQELAPKEDPGFVLTFAQGPEGATLDYMERYTTQIEAAYEQTPEIRGYFMFTGWPSSNASISFASFVDWDERERSSQEIAGQYFGQFMAIPGVNAYPQVPAAIGGGIFGSDLELVIQTSESYETLAEIVQQMQQRMGESPEFTGVRSQLQPNKPELRLTLNREKAAAVGVDINTLGRTIETYLGGRQVTRFKRGAEQYDVTVQLDRKDRATPDALSRVFVRSRDGAMIQLSNLVQIEEGSTLPSREHFNKLRSAQISSSLSPGVSLADAIGKAEALLSEVAGDRATYDLSGASREFRNVSANTTVLFILALAFIYLVLAAQFESFVDPLIILLAVPLAASGALLALKLTDGSINIYSQIGLITLIGLIAKHGILIVEFANQLRERGENALDAVAQAAQQRLRPILMTTGAMVLGAMPLAWAAGAGAEARQDIGWVIVGGLLVGTTFTLFVVPSIYLLFARWRPHAHAAIAESAST